MLSPRQDTHIATDATTSADRSSNCVISAPLSDADLDSLLGLTDEASIFDLLGLSPDDVCEFYEPPVRSSGLSLEPALLGVRALQSARITALSPTYRSSYKGDGASLLAMSRASSVLNGLVLRNETLGNRFALVNSVEHLESHLECDVAGHLVHEYVRGKYPLRAILDLDAKQTEIDACGYKREEIWDYISGAFITVIFRAGGNPEEVSIATSSDDSKLSSHLIWTGRLLVDYRELQGFLAAVRDLLPEEIRAFVDCNHASKEFSLRVVGCAKGGRTKVPTAQSIARGHTTLRAYLVQPDGIRPVSGSSLGRRYWSESKPSKPGRGPTVFSDAETELVISAALLAGGALDDGSPALRFRDQSDGFLNFDRDGVAMCPLCHRVHEKDGMYAYVAGGRWVLRCRRGEKKESADLCSAGGLPQVPAEATVKLSWAERLEKTVAAPLAPLALTATEAYAERSMRPYPLAYEVMAIKAPCKTGKSVTLRSWMQGWGRKFVLISHRRSFSAEWVAKANADGLDLLSYQDSKGDIALRDMRHRGIVIQYESLHRLDLDGAGEYIAICDEWVSILAQVEARLGKKESRAERHIAFARLLKKAMRVVAMDAYLDDGAVRVLEHYTGRKAHVVENLAPVHEGSSVLIYADQEATIQALISDVKEGNRVAVALDSVTLMNELKVKLEQEAPGRKILAYCGATDDSIKLRDFSDVGTAWLAADILLFTPTVEVGMSFEHKGHFVRQYGLFTNGTIRAEAALQMIFRVRDTTDFRMYLGYRAQGDIGASSPLGVLFDLHRASRELTKELDIDVRLSMFEDDDGNMKIVDNPRISAYCYNQSRINASKRAFHDIFLGWLHSWGAQLSMCEDRCPVEEARLLRSALKEIGEELAETEARAIAGAPELTYEDAELLNEKTFKSSEEKIALSAWHLRRTYAYSGPLTTEWVLRWGPHRVRRAYLNLSELRGAGSTSESASMALVRGDGVTRAYRAGFVDEVHWAGLTVGARSRENAIGLEVGDTKRGLMHLSAHRLVRYLGYGGIDDTASRTTAQIDESSKLNGTELTTLRNTARTRFGVIFDTTRTTKVKDSNSAIRLANAILGATYGMKLSRTRARAGGKRGYTYKLQMSGPFKAAAADGVVIPDWATEGQKRLTPAENGPGYTLEDVFR